MQKYADLYVKYAEVYLLHILHLYALPTLLMAVCQPECPGSQQRQWPASGSAATGRRGSRRAACILGVLCPFAPVESFWEAKVSIGERRHWQLPSFVHAVLVQQSR